MSEDTHLKNAEDDPAMSSEFNSAKSTPLT